MALDLSSVIGALVGLVFLVGGIGGEYVVLTQRPISVTLVSIFIGVTVFGALMLPSIFTMSFPRVRAIYLLVFPNGIPMFNGRRASDPKGPPGATGGESGEGGTP